MVLYCRFLEPVIFGDYPLSMRSLVGSRLPKFSEEQKKQLKGSVDFLGLNYYTALYAESAPPSSDPNKSYSTDSQATTTGVRMCVCVCVYFSRKYYKPK